MKWSYGVTTVPERIDTYLPTTLKSLSDGGFPEPRLFVDGIEDDTDYRSRFGLDVTSRFPQVNLFGSYVLSLWELYLREPFADRYVIFQDDLLCVRHLRNYLERCSFPNKGYWNLITHKVNYDMFTRRPGWYRSDQCGRGAVGLVFNRQGVIDLLTCPKIINRPTTAERDRAYRLVDAAVNGALGPLGYVEYVHEPSLLDHTGKVSTINPPRTEPTPNFPGTDFDASRLRLIPVTDLSY